MSTRCLPIRFLISAGLLAAWPALGTADTVLGSPRAVVCFEYARGSIGSLPAVDLCTEALEKDSLNQVNKAATYVNRGILLARRGRYSAAISDYTRALEINQTLVYALINRANVLVRIKRYEEALADYDQAVSYSEGRNPLAFYNRSFAYEYLGRSSEAREDLVRAVQLAPESAIYREALAAIE